MIDVTSVSDFNLHFVAQYSSRSFLVAGRFFDLVGDDFAQLSCEWYARNSFAEPKPGDRYVGQINGRDAIRYKSVDALVAENPKQLSPTGQHLYDQWLGIKANLEKTRKAPPPVVILPPPLEPPMYEPKPEPKAKPIELPPKQDEPKKNPPVWLAKFSAYFGIAAAISSVIVFFVPQAKPIVAAIVAIIKALLTASGV